jgi:subtilisin family serine protease
MRLMCIAALAALLLGCAKEDIDTNPALSIECSERTIGDEFMLMHPTGKIELVKAPETEMRKLQESGTPIHIEPNYKIMRQVRHDVRPMATRAYNDWGSLGVARYWNEGYIGQNLIVAVVDGGIEVHAPFFENRIVTNPAESGEKAHDGVDNDHNGYVDDQMGWNFVQGTSVQNDENGHGTGMAQVVGASWDSPVGPGIAPGVKILPVDFMDDEGGTEFLAVRAIEYALSRGARIINNSWATPCSKILKAKFYEWQQRGALFVQAAGNEGVNIDQHIDSSSNFRGPHFLSVGATERNGSIADYSNHGKNVLVYALGTDIWVARPITQSNYYSLELASGTSFSTSVISGAAALVWSRHPHWTAQDVREYLLPRKHGSPFFLKY